MNPNLNAAQMKQLSMTVEKMAILASKALDGDETEGPALRLIGCQADALSKILGFVPVRSYRPEAADCEWWEEPTDAPS
jgi:hypothetical protein